MPPSLRHFLTTLAVVSGLVVSATASATVTAPLSLEELVAASDAIVVGTVSDTSSQMLSSGGRVEVHTRVTIQVQRTLKGPSTESLTLLEPGGKTASGTRLVIGAPRYARGDEVVVFAERHPALGTSFRTVGLAQGKFDIRRGVRGSPSSVVRRLAGLAFLGRTGAPERPADRVPMSLEGFIAEILILVEGKRP